MPALYKYPPHPLCPHIQFKQLNPYLEDERPAWLENSQKESPGSGRALVVPTLAVREDAVSSYHSGPAAGPHLEAAARSSNGTSSVTFEKPCKESRREKERETAAQRELDALELKIPYPMSIVPECTITASGIHVSISACEYRVLVVVGALARHTMITSQQTVASYPALQWHQSFT